MGFSDDRVHIRTERRVSVIADEFRRVFTASEVAASVSADQHEEFKCFEVFRMMGSPWATIRCSSMGPTLDRFIPPKSAERLSSWCHGVAMEAAIYSSDACVISIVTPSGPAGEGIKLPMKRTVRPPQPPKRSGLEKAVEEFRLVVGDWVPNDLVESALQQRNILVDLIVGPLLLLCGISTEQSLGGDSPVMSKSESAHVIVTDNTWRAEQFRSSRGVAGPT
jgi:hypothetical protein